MGRVEGRGKAQLERNKSRLRGGTHSKHPAFFALAVWRQSDKVLVHLGIASYVPV